MQKYAKYLQKCLEANPHHPRAHYLQAIELSKNDDYKGAIDAYLKSIQYYSPSDRYHLNEAYNNLANVYYNMGDQVKAVKAWKIALEYSPTDKFAQRNLQRFGTSDT